MEVMPTQRSQSRTRIHDPTSSRSMSLAASRLEGATASPIEIWERDLTSDSLLARLAVRFDLPEPTEGLEEGPSSPLRAEYSRSIRSGSRGSSMASAFIHQSPTSVGPPSLISYHTEATPTETSISTGLANHLSGAVLLEDNNGVLEVPRTYIPTPMFECAFWFLSCGYISENQEEWTIHCESHFRGEEPPQTVQCPLCDWSVSSDDGRLSWKGRMQHLACEHTMLGQTLRTSRPDFSLFHFLFKRRLIDDQDYKELLGGNHNLTRPPGNFVETSGRNRRRERDERMHRRQHVAVTRPFRPQVA